MILKNISTKELDFEKSWEIGIKKLKSFSKFDKYMTIFWLLGPFIYLLERDPADVWLTLICIIFLIRCVYKKDWAWAKQGWFKATIIFWVTCLISAIISNDPYFSFGQGFVWIRFPLYAVTAQVWLAKDREIRILMLISILIGMLIMSLILFAEVIIEPKERLTWPYGDLIPGTYLSKFSLPLFCAIIAIAVSKVDKVSLYLGIIVLFTISASVMTGERINLLIRICAGFLAGLVWRPRTSTYITMILIGFLGLGTLFLANKNKAHLYTTSLYNSIPILNTNDDNPYWGSWRGGIQQALITPIMGNGPSGTRKTCEHLPSNQPLWLPGKNYCGNHPHNFYIQLLAETGIIGFIFGTSMMILIILKCLKARGFRPNCPMASTAFIIPLALFFPLQQFGSFFGQWGNLFLWFAIGFALSQCQSTKDKTN